MKWDYIGFNYDSDKEYRCSHCKNTVINIKYPYCPWCGEKQDKKETVKKN